MQFRLKMDVKTILKGMLVPALFIFLQSVPVHAETGDLKINNQVIYEKNEGSQNNSATFTINQLFMKEMSDQDKQLDEEKMTLITNAQKEVFMKETPAQRTVDQQITPLLFSSGYVLNDSLDSGDSGLKNGNNIGFILLCVVGGLFVVGLGIILGRAFPTWVKKG
ncbi:hypothetical protein [Enterococcus caccae]|uniref:Type VII secretion protein EssA n=1 Tax=Enterococcus caccae ATCC BAA-1240 TaxID=1158612 RepID=R3TV91_9ENTE|nr:hypothetical protein [Enterococcus caccae]EOL45068.1 hypothetical protein UC7_01874 [Enterococcus caccae ATCC BAA-1240]EOT58475.1 hypothetical protein I580_02646 [Enterococcus caccae ATCC BAA-1240]